MSTGSYICPPCLCTSFSLRVTRLGGAGGNWHPQLSPTKRYGPLCTYFQFVTGIYKLFWHELCIYCCHKRRWHHGVLLENPVTRQAGFICLWRSVSFSFRKQKAINLLASKRCSLTKGLLVININHLHFDRFFWRVTLMCCSVVLRTGSSPEYTSSMFSTKATKTYQ